VIRRRFNWQQREEHPLTLEEVGQIIGVTKERVRQIQNKALAKIRLVMEDGVLRTKPRTADEVTKAAEDAGEAKAADVVNPSEQPVVRA
jgi:RNA polymerase primary sigma factor